MVWWLLAYSACSSQSKNRRSQDAIVTLITPCTPTHGTAVIETIVRDAGLYKRVQLLAMASLVYQAPCMPTHGAAVVDTMVRDAGLYKRVQLLMTVTRRWSCENDLHKINFWL